MEYRTFCEYQELYRRGLRPVSFSALFTGAKNKLMQGKDLLTEDHLQRAIEIADLQECETDADGERCFFATSTDQAQVYSSCRDLLGTIKKTYPDRGRGMSPVGRRIETPATAGRPA